MSLNFICLYNNASKMLLLVLLIQAIHASPHCLFATTTSLPAADLNYTVALAGCQSVSPCGGGVNPLVSFIGSELDDLAVFQCTNTPLTACAFPKLPLSYSVRYALEFRLFRALTTVGLTAEYWTFSNMHGEILPTAYVSPTLDTWLLGNKRVDDTSASRRWMCICNI